MIPQRHNFALYISEMTSLLCGGPFSNEKKSECVTGSVSTFDKAGLIWVDYEMILIFFLFCEWVCVVVIVMSTWRTQQESHQCFVVWHELEGSVTYDLCYQWVNHVSLFLTEFGNLMLLSNEWMSAMFSQIEGVVMIWQPTAVKRETTVWDSISTFIGVKTLDILNETLGYWQQYQIVLPRLEDNFQPSLWWQHPWSQNMIFS